MIPSAKVFQMKPDMKYFNELKDDADFPEWWEHTVSTMHGTNVGELVDWDYVPESRETESYHNKDKWMYTVLQNKLKTAIGKDILYQHRISRSGSKVLYDLEHEYSTSTTADLKADELMLEITTGSIAGYEGKLIEYIPYFTHLMTQYNETVRFSDQRLTQGMQRAHLERAVSAHKSLREVKDRETHMIAMQGSSGRLPFAKYLYLLREAAKVADKARSVRGKVKRSGNMHVTTDNSDESEETSVVGMFRAFMAQQHLEGSRMERDTWRSLNPDTREKWDTIDAEEKAKILSSSGSTKPRPRRSANAHHVSMEDEEDEKSLQEGEGEDTTPSIQANEANSKAADAKSKVHPADPRRVLGGNNGGSKRKANHVRWKANYASIVEHLSDDESLGLDDNSEAPDMVPRPSDDESVESDDGQESVPSYSEYWGEQEDQFF